MGGVAERIGNSILVKMMSVEVRVIYAEDHSGKIE